MFRRISKVDVINLTSVAFASKIQIGDSESISGNTRAIAVQRQREIFYGNEGDFRLFKIFSTFLPLPPINESITMHTRSTNPVIKVGRIDATAFSTSAFLHVGSTEHIQMETRVLHIRQIETVNEPKDSQR